MTFGGEEIRIWWGEGMISKFLAGGGGDLPYHPVGKTLSPLYIYIYIIYIYYIYIYIYYKYIFIKELCQQVFTCSEEAPSTSHTSCAKVAIVLLQDENLSTLCVTDVYGICFHLSAQCSYYNKCITP